MADKKISQLTAVSTPLAGTEVLPVVQNGVTKKVTVIELTDFGKELQVVSDKKTDAFSTSSQDVYVTTGQSANITPSSESSKILVIFSAGSVVTTVANTGGGVQVRRDGNVVAEAQFYQATVAGNLTSPFGSLIALDSPNSTSTLTYEVFAQEIGIPGTIGLNQPRNLILIEIAP